MIIFDKLDLLEEKIDLSYATTVAREEELEAAENAEIEDEWDAEINAHEIQFRQEGLERAKEELKELEELHRLYKKHLW